MDITITLTPEQEDALRSAAARNGVTPEQFYAHHITRVLGLLVDEQKAADGRDLEASFRSLSLAQRVAIRSIVKGERDVEPTEESR